MITEEELRQQFIIQHPAVGEYFIEVPVFSRSVDMVIRAGDLITAIEFKLTNINKVIEQAERVRISFDYCSICILQPRTDQGQKSVIEKCKDHGVGLFFYDPAAGVFTNPIRPEQNQIWIIQKEKVIELISAGNYLI